AICYLPGMRNSYTDHTDNTDRRKIRQRIETAAAWLFRSHFFSLFYPCYPCDPWSRFLPGRPQLFFASSFADTFSTLYGCSARMNTSPLRASHTPRMTYFVVVTSPTLPKPPWNGRSLPFLSLNSVKFGLLTETGPWSCGALSP